MKIKVLGSSSKGNCYIIETATSTLVLEAGIKFEEVKKNLNFNLDKVCGCLVTHEHKDHSKYVADFLKYGIKVFTSKGTSEQINIKNHNLVIIDKLKLYKISDFTVLPFDVHHDVVEPFGYLIQYNPTKQKILFATDTYYLKYNFKDIDIYMVECNSDLQTLEENLKNDSITLYHYKRLRQSHMSLETLVDFFRKTDLSKTQKILLLHLSDKNSNEKRIQSVISDITKKESIIAKNGIEIEV